MSMPDKTDSTYEKIFSDIIRNVYDQSSILTEKTLIEKYNVSRSPVREALLMLCNEGILQSVPRVGYLLTPLNMKDLLDAGALRMIIEMAAMDIYFPLLNDSHIEKLENLFEKGITIEKEKDAYVHWLLNKEFHMTLTSFSNNSYFTKVLSQIMKQCFRGASQYYGESWAHNLHREDMRWHRKLIDAFKEKDKDKAKEILSSDINDYLSSFNQIKTF